WTPLDSAWPAGYSHLERFVAREGHARVPNDHLEDGYRLGQWVADQRNFHRSGRLSEERAARLQALTGWGWETFHAGLEGSFSALANFAAREGHTRVKRGHVEGGRRLGQWVDVQRTFYASGRVAPERAARLEALPRWAWNIKDAEWEEGYDTLLRFLARDGH